MLIGQVEYQIPVVTPLTDFNLTDYISLACYIQQHSLTVYQQEEEDLFCATVTYELWGRKQWGGSASKGDVNIPTGGGGGPEFCATRKHPKVRLRAPFLFP